MQIKKAQARQARKELPGIMEKVAGYSQTVRELSGIEEDNRYSVELAQAAFLLRAAAQSIGRTLATLRDQLDGRPDAKEPEQNNA